MKYVKCPCRREFELAVGMESQLRVLQLSEFNFKLFFVYYLNCRKYVVVLTMKAIAWHYKKYF